MRKATLLAALLGALASPAPVWAACGLVSPYLVLPDGGGPCGVASNATVAAKAAAAQTLTVTGDVTGSGTLGGGSVNVILPNVVAAGTNPKVSYDAKGRVVAGGPLLPADVTNGGGALITALTSETGRATAAELTTANGLTSEIGLARGNEAAEVTRATAAEGGIAGTVTTERTRATGAEGAIAGSVTAEATTARAAEGANATAAATAQTQANLGVTNAAAAQATASAALPKSGGTVTGPLNAPTFSLSADGLSTVAWNATAGAFAFARNGIAYGTLGPTGLVAAGRADFRLPINSMYSTF